jgi:hypothetical protein
MKNGIAGVLRRVSKKGEIELREGFSRFDFMPPTGFVLARSLPAGGFPSGRGIYSANRRLSDLRTLISVVLHKEFLIRINRTAPSGK